MYNNIFQKYILQFKWKLWILIVATSKHEKYTICIYRLENTSITIFIDASNISTVVLKGVNYIFKNH